MQWIFYSKICFEWSTSPGFVSFRNPTSKSYLSYFLSKSFKYSLSSHPSKKWHVSPFLEGSGFNPMAGSALLDQKKNTKKVPPTSSISWTFNFLAATSSPSMPFRFLRLKGWKTGSLGQWDWHLIPMAFIWNCMELLSIPCYIYIYIDPYLIPNKYLSYIQLSDYSNYE